LREARMLELPLKQAEAIADIDVVSSCYCRKDNTCAKVTAGVNGGCKI
jgi:hypothetical protein